MGKNFGKLTGQAFGRGKAKVQFTRAFHRLEPEDQMAVLAQAMLQLRNAHKEAERNHRIRRQHEDALNAAAIRVVEHSR